MSLSKKVDSVMFKIFQIMNKISKFSNQMTELTPSTDYSIEERKTPKKKKTKKKSQKKRKKKSQNTTKPEILGFDYKQIGDRMLNQGGRNDEM